MQWIFELPIDGLPAHVLNLRRILQASTGSSITREKEDLATAKAEISAKVHGFFRQIPLPKVSAARKCGLSHLSQTTKSALGRWIRRAVASQLVFCPQDAEQHDTLRAENAKRPRISITPEQYRKIRRILEILDEYPILADVIKICSNSVDITVLTIASDTVNYHFDIFSAIGAANDLFQAIYDRYEKSYGQTETHKTLTESLIDLDYRLSHPYRERSRRQPKLLMYQPNSILAACSPISDYMGEPLQSSEPAFMDAVEQSFTSGNLMEKQVLEQVFMKVTARLQQSWQGLGDKSLNTLTDLLLRLRNYGVSQFEELLHQWLNEFVASTSRPRLQDALPSLVCAGLIKLATVLERILGACDAVAEEEHGARLSLEAFELLTLPHKELEPSLIYVRFFGQEIFEMLIIQ